MNDEIRKPLITTIIPTYRRPKLLRRAIKSVLNQTYPHFQVCVYDNASGDETAQVVAELAEEDLRVKYHCHPRNIGAIKNFIYGMEHVNTPFFSFLSDDDFLLPEFYQTALAGFDKHPEAIFSATSSIVMNPDGKVLGISLRGWRAGFYEPPDGLLAMLRNGHPTWTGVLYRKEVIPNIDANFISSDMSVGLIIAGHFPFVISLKPGAIFLSHASSFNVSTRFQLPWFPIWTKLIKKLNDDRGLPANVRVYSKDVLEQLIKRRLFGTGMEAIIMGHYDVVDNILSIFQEHYPGSLRAHLILFTKQTCKFFPPLRFVFAFLYKVRRSLLQRKSQHLQREFGQFARFLED